MSIKQVFIVLIGFICLNQLVQAKHPHCKEALGIFADRNMKFIGCSVKGSEPVSICQDCVLEYRDLDSAYTNISLTLDTKNVSCSVHYLNLDKLSILETVHLNSVNLWSTANCDACFNPDNITLTNFTHKFLVKSTEMNYCLTTAINKCEDCEKNYLILNELYETEKRFSQLCFDLEDIMNKTRLTWSGTYKCCKDKKDSLTAFIVTASILSSIPVIFYIGLYFYGVMQNSHYEHLDVNNISDRGSINTVSVPSGSNPGPSSTIVGSMAETSSNTNNTNNLKASGSSRPSTAFEDRPLPAVPKPKTPMNLLSDIDSDDDAPAN